ncbi:MAG: PHP domain-containing protein [Lachnospiraceae bacterium]|nr:PHP domain-containing protein [Lachnospiraceae bacterium]
MKIDMHCHTKEGSPDAGVSIEEYIEKLRSLGFGGMVVTDHDSYDGYRYYKENLWDKYDDFVVFKGVEYDTIDGGHIICIMPESLKLRILEMRGMPVSMLIDIVHKHGGILGPAHPCGSPYMSFCNTKKNGRVSTMLKFDFVEAFNACENEESNSEARVVANVYHKPGTGGSDAHRLDCVGMAWTNVPGDIKTESDLIAYIKNGAIGISCGGELYGKTAKDRLGPLSNVLVQGFWFYNKAGAIMKRHKRKLELKKKELFLKTGR